MTKLLVGKTAVVTGSNRGIGRSILEVLARNGAAIFACARKPDDAFSEFLARLEREELSNLTPIYFDFSNLNEVREGARTILLKATRIDVIVNNAGVIHTSLFQMTPIEKIREVYEINLFSQIAFTQNLVRKMCQARSGSIINISSSAAIEGNEGRLAYAGSKAAMISSSKVMARELGTFNIRVNAVAPGLTDTDMMRGNHKEDAIANTVARVSLKRIAKPEEIANVVLFLASDLSSYMTGQVLRVDGGM